MKSIVGLILVVSAILAACAGQADNSEQNILQGNKSEQGRQSISINGSTSVQPLVEELAAAYKEDNPNAIIDIQSGGSGVGIKSAMDGVVDIGMSSRELKTDEKKSERIQNRH